MGLLGRELRPLEVLQVTDDETSLPSSAGNAAPSSSDLPDSTRAAPLRFSVSAAASPVRERICHPLIADVRDGDLIPDAPG